MEDLVPFLIFLAIGAVKLLGFLAKKGKPTGTDSSKRPPSQLEHFFEQLSEQLNPQEPTKLPDWPEGYERPDYVHEMEEFKEPQLEIEPEPPVPEFHPPEPPVTVFTTPRPSCNDRLRTFQGLRQAMLAHIVLSPPKALDDTLSK